MRRVVFFLGAGALAMVAVSVTSAQAGWLETFGVRFGLSSSRLFGDFGKAYGGDYQHGLAAAAFWRFSLGRSFSFQSEIGWVGKGGDGIPGSFFDPGPPAEVTEFHVQTRVQYVEFPLLVRLDVPAAGPLHPYVLTGPAPAIKLGVRQRVESRVRPAPGATGPQLQYAFIFEEIGTLGGQRVRPFDLGLVGGAGVVFGSGRARVVLEGRYAHGLLDMIEGGVESRNAGFATTLGLELR
jgi:hypothetical protein